MVAAAILIIAIGLAQDGLPASIETIGVDPTNGGLQILLEKKLIESPKAVTLNVDADNAMKVIVDFRDRRYLPVQYRWMRKAVLTRHYKCTLVDYAGVNRCSGLIIRGAKEAALHFIKGGR